MLNYFCEVKEGSLYSHCANLDFYIYFPEQCISQVVTGTSKDGKAGMLSTPQRSVGNGDTATVLNGLMLFLPSSSSLMSILI